jgi:hypothetical protein
MTNDNQDTTLKLLKQLVVSLNTNLELLVNSPLDKAVKTRIWLTLSILQDLENKIKLLEYEPLNT